MNLTDAQIEWTTYLLNKLSKQGRRYVADMLRLQVGIEHNIPVQLRLF